MGDPAEKWENANEAINGIKEATGGEVTAEPLGGEGNDDVVVDLDAEREARDVSRAAKKADKEATARDIAAIRTKVLNNTTSRMPHEEATHRKQWMEETVVQPATGAEGVMTSRQMDRRDRGNKKGFFARLFGGK